MDQASKKNRSPATTPDRAGAMTKKITNTASVKSVSSTSSRNQSVCLDSPSQSKVLECDFDSNPTKLYLSIQHKKWDEVCENARACPEQSKTWVSRRESNSSSKNSDGKKKKLRWRLLPLHAAVIFKAPEKVIEALIVSYPRACHFKDDQGMIPLHLAIRNESSEDVVNLLLLANPKSVNIGDRKGRIPSVLVNSANSPRKEGYLKALDRAQSYYSVAIAAQEQDEIRKKTAIIDIDAQKVNLMAKIDLLEAEVKKSKEENQKLMNHTRKLEETLHSKSSSESSLPKQLANMDSKLGETTENIKQDDLVKENEDLRADCEALKEEIELRKAISVEKEKSLQGKCQSTAAVSFERETLEKRIKSLELENSCTLANAALVEAQLKKRIQNEHVLASQVSDLATKLSENALMSSETTAYNEKKIETIKNEKMKLKQSYDHLCHKLHDALKTMDDMTSEHNRILQISANQERVIAKAWEKQEELVVHAERHEQSLIDAAWEREEIVRILSRQAEEIERGSAERKRLLSAVKTKTIDIDTAKSEKKDLVNAINKQKVLMESFRQEVSVLYDAVNDELDGISYDEHYNENEENDPFLAPLTPSLRTPKMKMLNPSSMTMVNDNSIIVGKEIYGMEESFAVLPNPSTLSSDEDDIPFTDISLNMKNLSKLNDVESSVDNLCKEAAALIASIPSPKGRSR